MGPWARLMLVLAYAVAAAPATDRRVARLRDLSRLPRPADHAAGPLMECLQARANAVRQSAGMRPAAPSALAATRLRPPRAGTTINPADYGADPTGGRDSSAAISAAVGGLLAACSPSSPAEAGRHLAFNISDCGGATLDLHGGTFLLSAPLALPPWHGNLHITAGTLRAGGNFPADRWLVELGDPHQVCDHICHEDITVTSVFFDAAHVAAGGLLSNNAMGCVVSQSYFLGFRSSGVNITGGHEMLVDSCWLGEVWWNEPVPAHSRSIGILINGNDHAVTDSVLFAFESIGIEINSPGAMIHNVHVWNGLHAGNGPGIHLGPGGTATRLTDCYWDNSFLNIVDPSRVIVTGGFFYQANVVLVSGPRQSIIGLVLEDNIFSALDVPCPAHPRAIPNVQAVGSFARGNVSQVHISDSDVQVSSVPTVASSVSRSLSAVEASVFRFELHESDNTTQPRVLLFGWIDALQYSVAYTTAGAAGFVAHRADVNGSSVRVVFERPVSATVFLTASQGEQPAPKA